jgi:tRNA pseudouridine32 synthase / 23S rRNA pseudouridine746 synthase
MFKTIFLNDDWIVVDKPPEWLSVPGRTGALDQRPCLGVHLQKQLGKAVFPVHRLDFEVSGVMLFALTRDTHRRANLWFEKRLVQKTYLALSDGRVSGDFAEWQNWESKLVRGKKRTFSAPYGQKAETRAKCSNSGEEGPGRWILQPLTGRSHQLRFEMATRGFPIVGDSLYGSQVPWTEPGIALRATELDFSKCESVELSGLPKVIEVSGL